MKKISITLIMLLTINSIQAQIKTANKHSAVKAHTRAMNDTLFYMSLPYSYIANPLDSSMFTIQIEDLDMLTPFNSWFAMDFGLYYSTDSTTNGGNPSQNNFYHPWENPLPTGTDTAFFWMATSYFAPAGTADNWLEFGPVTVPLTGATLTWYDRTSDNRDGYEVRLTSTISGMPISTDFTDPPIFSKSDAASPSPTYATDTTWQLRTVALPSTYNGMQVYFAFHHNATNMDILCLDEITVIDDSSSTATCDPTFLIVQDTANLYNYTIYSSASSGPGISYYWDFGDTTSSTLQYPTHTYVGSGPYQICLTVSDTSGCSNTFCDTIIPGMWSSATTTITVVSATTGIVEVLQNNTFNVFPNPANDAATIRFTLMKDEMVNVSIVDLLGKKTATVNQRNMIAGKNELQWNTEEVSDGMYLIQIQVGETKFTKKLIVSKK